MRRLEGKVALIVGIDEIALAIARRFDSEGAAIALLDVRPERAHAEVPPIARSSDWMPIIADLAGGEHARRAASEVIERNGTIHILVNNTVAPVTGSPLEEKTDAQLDVAMRQVKAAFWMMQAVFPSMRDQRWGRIISLGSRYGELMNHHNGEYNTAVWALRGLTRTAAAEWARHRIAVNVLEYAACTADFLAFHDRNRRIVDALLAQIPMRRRGDLVEDVGAAAVMLACDECNLMTGQVLYADGGQHLAAPAFNLAIDHAGAGSQLHD